MAISGIYWIRNTISGKFYVGSSVDIKVRWRQHRYKLKAGNHTNQILQRAWFKYGREAFKFEVIEEVPLAQLIEVEEWYLIHTRCTDRRHGYNICRSAKDMSGANNPMFGRTMPESARAILSVKATGRKNSTEQIANRVASLMRQPARGVTGEKHIYPKRNNYQVRIHHTTVGTFADKADAVRARDTFLVGRAA